MDALLRKLGELTLERCVREDVLSLQREMTFMQAALRNVAEVSLDEQVVLCAGALLRHGGRCPCDVRRASMEDKDRRRLKALKLLSKLDEDFSPSNFLRFSVF
jgi:hypothetical protein